MRAKALSLIAATLVPVIAPAQSAPHADGAPKPLADPTTTSVFPEWMAVGGQLRARMEGYTGGGFRPDNSDTYALTRVLLNARVYPTRLTSLFVEGMDARGPWKNKAPAGAPFRDNADLRQFYLQIGTDNSPQLLRAGRLELGFGDGRLVGSLPWANTARTFDGARAAFLRPGLRIDAFGASVVKVDQVRFDKNVPGNNFYGMYVSANKLLRNTALEPFVFWRRQSGVAPEVGPPSVLNFGTYGIRAAGRAANIDYDTQVAMQRGSLAAESVRAWAGHWLLGYTVAVAPFTPRLFAEYNHASGDGNPTDNRKETFDQLYPTGHDKYGLTDLVGWQNMNHVRTGLDLSIAKGWSASARYSSYWLADAHDALYTGGGAVLARSPTGTAGTYVGQEIDLVASGKIRPGLGFSAGAGRFIPRTFLRSTTPGHSYTYPYAMVTYDF